ncbi:hypothetical protein KRR40_06670 [Niabella defluvii]|nr:hypothetical protein KRR40_06670 [Niabella sp. I65]
MEQEGSDKTAFHFRIALDQTSSFRYLSPQLREKIWNLYIDYFYRRQNDFWKKESLKNYPGLKPLPICWYAGKTWVWCPIQYPV